MEHKAFLFDFERFNLELRPLLEVSLGCGSCLGLKNFIEEHFEQLCDPYEGEPLRSGWEAMLEAHDPHQYGDFALTKYYDPLADIGLGHDWESLQAIVAALVEAGSPILGITVGPYNDPFDPGKMGSYFQSEELVLQNLRSVEGAYAEKPEEIGPPLAMLKAAADAGTGLYVTF
jgi:hypothetical protein